MVAESGGPLIGLGAAPLQDRALALAELRHVVETLGLAGVGIGSNVGGVASATRASILSSQPAKRSVPLCSCMRSSRPGWIAAYPAPCHRVTL